MTDITLPRELVERTIDVIEAAQRGATLWNGMNEIAALRSALTQQAEGAPMTLYGDVPRYSRNDVSRMLESLASSARAQNLELRGDVFAGGLRLVATPPSPSAEARLRPPLTAEWLAAEDAAGGVFAAGALPAQPSGEVLTEAEIRTLLFRALPNFERYEDELGLFRTVAREASLATLAKIGAGR